jgi:hypothetical protein
MACNKGKRLTGDDMIGYYAGGEYDGERPGVVCMGLDLSQ